MIQTIGWVRTYAQPMPKKLTDAVKEGKYDVAVEGDAKRLEVLVQKVASSLLQFVH